jgi:hypothetical protein
MEYYIKCESCQGIGKISPNNYWEIELKENFLWVPYSQVKKIKEK